VHPTAAARVNSGLRHSRTPMSSGRPTDLECGGRMQTDGLPSLSGLTATALPCTALGLMLDAAADGVNFFLALCAPDRHATYTWQYSMHLAIQHTPQYSMHLACRIHLACHIHLAYYSICCATCNKHLAYYNI
jgi:hypothetical protein